MLTAKMLKEKGIIQSMSRKGVPQDNGPAESFFSHQANRRIYTILQ
ncbi:hypothetical protein [Thermosipho melanesiensis]|nr:hypothetical protein [Thermosipho melanesiensis]